jgi:protein-disulfide isomerase
VLSRLQAANPDDMRIIFRHYPLDQTCNPNLRAQVHPGACAAAIAAECASEQGKFWEYADLLFADQKQYTRQDLEGHAATLDLDLEGFAACLDDSRMRSRIDEDIEEAERINVKATPTLIINGRLIEGAPPPEKLATLITLEKQRAAKP